MRSKHYNPCIYVMVLATLLGTAGVLLSMHALSEVASPRAVQEPGAFRSPEGATGGISIDLEPVKYNNMKSSGPSSNVFMFKEISIISREPGVDVTCDVRGNLGPCSVVVQNPPGSDWIKDRWQAASDMGGTAIPGSHWVILDFKETVQISSVRIDWETAFSEVYRLEGRMSVNEDWIAFYDGTIAAERAGDGLRTSFSTGQSPGVKTKTPLHVVHTMNFTTAQSDPHARYESYSNSIISLRYLRLFIVKPAMGWGVSIWQLDVFGFK